MSPGAVTSARADTATTGRTGRAMMTWASSGVYTAVTVAVGLVSTPIIVTHLGDAAFGAFRATSDWIGYLLLADLGLGTALGVILMRARSVSDTQARHIVRYALRILGWMAPVPLALGAVMAWYMPSLIRDGQAMQWELRAAAGIGVLGLAFGPLTIFRSYLEVTQRGYLINAGLLAQSLVVTVASIAFATTGYGLVGQATATLLGTSLFVALTAWWSVPDIRTAGPMGSNPPVEPRTLWRLSWPLAAAAVGNRLNLMTDGIVIGKMLGVTELAALFLTQRVILLCAGQVNALANSSWAALAELRQAGERERFEARLLELTRLIVGGGLVIVGSVAAFNRAFVSLWVGPHLYGGDLLTVATLASVVVFGFFLPFAWAIDVAGETRLRLVPSTIGSVLNLGLSILFVTRWGVAGVALGTLCAYLLTDAWYCPWLVCRRYGVSASGVRNAVIRGCAVGLPWVTVTWALARLEPTPGWIGLTLQGVVVGSGAVAYCWFFLLTSGDRADWAARVGRFVP